MAARAAATDVTEAAVLTGEKATVRAAEAATTRVPANLNTPLDPRSAVWREGPVERGRQLHAHHGENLPANFPTIDRFTHQDGVATSIKSIDLNRKTYQNPQRLKSRLTRYVDKVAEFRGAESAKPQIRAFEIQSRVLDVVVPHLGHSAQRAVLQEVAEYATSQGVTLKITPYP